MSSNGNKIVGSVKALCCIGYGFLIARLIFLLCFHRNLCSGFDNQFIGESNTSVHQKFCVFM